MRFATWAFAACAAWIAVIPVRSAPLDSVVSIRFAGEGMVSDTPGLAVMAKVQGLPETEAFRAALADKIASKVTKTADARVLVRQLLEDVGRAPSGFEVWRMESGKSLWTLALRLTADRAALWSTNLWQLASKTSLGDPKAAGSASGWTWTVSSAEKNYHLAFGAKEGWIVFSGGESSTPTATPLSSNPSASIPGGGRLTFFKANLPALGGMMDRSILFAAPKITAEAYPQGDGLKGEVVLDFEADLPIQPKPWAIPAETIRDPLVSFTAVQGIGPLLALLPQFQALGPVKTPDQIFFWSQEISAFSLYAAADVGNPGEMVAKFVANHLPTLAEKLKAKALGRMVPSEDKQTVSWRDLPMIVPTFSAAGGSESGFLLAQLFPTTNLESDPAPAGLFDQLRKATNILAYDWEITEAKLGQLRPLLQIVQIMNGKEFSPPDGAGQKWLAAVAPLLGNTITETTLANPRQIKISRRSHIGYSALELALAASWVDARPMPRKAKAADQSNNNP